MRKFAVLGNPIAHSKSPLIHKLFSEQIGVKQEYIKIYVPLNYFNKKLLDFFKDGGYGANITIPFKEEAYKICNMLTVRAKNSGVVNTTKVVNKKILGDNTDGIGFFNDLKKKFTFYHKNILILGAGGAAKGIISFLKDLNCNITIVNRTFINAQNIILFFKNIPQLHCISLQDFQKTNIIYHKYDLIINATSSSMNHTILELPNNIIHPKIFCYDIFYSKKLTPFLKWCYNNGTNNLFNGIGMLVEQAAYSFKLWYGIKPNTNNVIQYLQNKII
ncbi:shikimate dehydrogenase [Enterobacteriaceae endosymbiont of Neohaemonia nigricornis]|uniref:shikimate dehydrogenase n=1 Tax=Enterobacteriaceae endosymbiont of Neohaemonia nigricornis TaxID=2675792 RepID=UPI001449732D|nr:shikimate dehydrogenase [Enterobacteriaceae endosymbiont of Neohaemonia nigricornis]QJC30440.1 shikimate dehydrogenase [Enterobacteriaceae endosymbiont of Neohaemonia nigricornis]